MAYELSFNTHRFAARREDEAAMRAACEVSAQRHSELAEMHRREADRIDAVRTSLRLAFGD